MNAAQAADETKEAGMPAGGGGGPEAVAAEGAVPDPEAKPVVPPSRQRTLTRTEEMDADGDDIELDADGDDAADSITLELALSPHSSTPTPPPTTADEDFAQLDNSKPFKVWSPMSACIL